MSERGVRKMEWRQHRVRENVKRGTESGMARENMELRKLVMILVLYDVRVLSRCQNLCGTETILSYV